MRNNCEEKGMKQGGQKNCYHGKKGCGRRGSLAQATGEWGHNRKGATKTEETATVAE